MFLFLKNIINIDKRGVMSHLQNLDFTNNVPILCYLPTAKHIHFIEPKDALNHHRIIILIAESCV